MSDIAQQEELDEITNLKLLNPVDRLVDDTSFDAIVVIDCKGLIQNINVTTLTEFGYESKNELMGTNISLLVGGGEAVKHDQYLVESSRCFVSATSSKTTGNNYKDSSKI